MGEAIKFGRGKIIMPKKLSEYVVGDTVKINVNGSSTEFIVVHQGKPSSLYDDSCDGTWLLMKDIYESRLWHSSAINSYKDSTIHSYLNRDFLNLFDANVREQIKTVKIPYVNGTGSSSVASGASGLSAQIFLLSCYEVGWTQSNNSYFPIDGACLSYFNGFSATDSKRIGYLNGTATFYWLRSTVTNGTTSSWLVNNSGGPSYYYCSNSYGVRPAFTLPSTAKFDPDTNLFLRG